MPPKISLGPLPSTAILLILFFGGGAQGTALAEWLAPNSYTAAFLSFLLLPFAMIVGFHAWLGVAALILIPRLATRLFRRPPPRRNRVHSGMAIPPGGWMFLPIASALGLAGGALVGLISTERAFWFVASVYWVVGMLYGALLWVLARLGYLPFPESE